MASPASSRRGDHRDRAQRRRRHRRLRLPRLDAAADQHAGGSGPGGRPAGARPAAPAEFTVASFNLQRLFDTVNDPIGEPVATPDAYQLRLGKLSAADPQLPARPRRHRRPGSRENRGAARPGGAHRRRCPRRRPAGAGLRRSPVRRQRHRRHRRRVPHRGPGDGRGPHPARRRRHLRRSHRRAIETAERPAVGRRCGSGLPPRPARSRPTRWSSSTTCGPSTT